MKRHTYIFSSLSVSTLVAAMASQGVQAKTAAEQFAVCGSNNSIFGISPWYACLPGGNDGAPRVEKLTDLFLIIFPILDALVKIGAYVAAAYMFWCIIQFLIARGNPGKAATAMNGIRDAVIGFIITLISVAIVNFISSAFTPR